MMNSYFFYPRRLKFPLCSAMLIEYRVIARADCIAWSKYLEQRFIYNSVVSLQLKMAGKKTSITSFNDSSISRGHVVIDLVDACKPGSVKYENVKEGATEKVGLLFTSILSVYHHTPLTTHNYKHIIH